MRQKVEGKTERIRHNNRGQEGKVDRKVGLVVVCVKGKVTEEERSTSWTILCLYLPAISYDEERPVIFPPAIHYSPAGSAHLLDAVVYTPGRTKRTACRGERFLILPPLVQSQVSWLTTAV